MFSTTTKNHIFLVISETSLKQVKIKGGGVQVYHFGKYDFELKELEWKARTYTDILRVVLGPCVQY